MSSNFLSFPMVVLYSSQKSRFANSCFLGVSATASNKCVSRKDQRSGPTLVLVRSPRHHRIPVMPISRPLARQLLWSVTLSCYPLDLRVWRGRGREINVRGHLASPSLCSSAPHPSRTLHCPSAHESPDTGSYYS